MASSYIIEISENPIPKDSRISESDFYEEMPHFADYVADLTESERDEVIKGFKKNVNDDSEPNDAFVISREYKDSLVEKQLSSLKRFVNGLSMEDFGYPKEILSPHYIIKSMVSNEFGDWMYESESGGRSAFFEWLCENAKVDTRYYIGGIVRFHF